MTTPTIDIHNHGYAKKFIDACRRGEGERYGIRLANDSKGDVLLRPDGVSFRLQSKRTDYPAQLSELATVGIDVIALSTLPYINFGACEEKTVVWACQRINDGFAEIQQEYSGRIYGIGMAPLPYGRAAAAELTRANRELGLRAVQILSSIEGRNLDDPEFLPFFERAEELAGNPAHSSRRARQERTHGRLLHAEPDRQSLGNRCGRLRALFLAASWNVFPNLKIILAHGGGVAPSLIGRWRHGHAHRAGAARQVHRFCRRDVQPALLRHRGV